MVLFMVVLIWKLYLLMCHKPLSYSFPTRNHMMAAIVLFPDSWRPPVSSRPFLKHAGHRIQKPEG